MVESLGMVELLQAGSSPPSASAAPWVEVPMYWPWRKASPVRSMPGPLPYQMPVTPWKRSCGNCSRNCVP